MSRGSAKDASTTTLTQAGQAIVDEEVGLLREVHARIAREAEVLPTVGEDLDAQLIELRDAIGEAKEEDVPSLIDQMHQVAALSRRRGQGRAIPIDPNNPYFGHLRLQEARTRKERDILIGRHTLLDDGDGVTIVDWRNAPVSRLYYRYEEGDEYEEEFDDRMIAGQVVVRRSVAVQEGDLRRVASPQGTFAKDRTGSWHEAAGSIHPTLAGGAGSAIRVQRGRLGIHGDEDIPRADKHLQEITALIDPEQFRLITRPESGIVLIQGGAGSGKTTVALHRVAYLAFQDPKRFHPSKMIVIVFNDGLVEYIRHVLPSLGVEGVHVSTYRRWTAQLLRRVKLPLPVGRAEHVPEVVSRFKKHPVLLKLMDALVEEQQQEIRRDLVERLNGREGGALLIDAWDQTVGAVPVARVARVRKWLAGTRQGQIAPQARAAAETVLSAAAERLPDVVFDWLELNTDGNRLAEGIRKWAATDFSDNDVGAIVRWCAKKADVALPGEDSVEESPVLPDPEDDAILLRLLQLKFGGIYVGGRRFEYEHIVIDEAQDLCPLEVRILLDSVSAAHSVTIAGDKAQKMVFDNGFTDWPQLLDDAGLPHTKIHPLRITYRSTRQVMEISRHVLGPLHDPSDELVAREGAPVSFFQTGDVGDIVAFLGDALRGLMQREPSASVALITRYPQQADIYYDALRLAEVPRLRRVRTEDFTFSAGIDVTDVRQVKGLEFDYVVLLDTTRHNYPEEIQARHLLHIAATRAAHQLWMVCAGAPSKLLPEDLVVSGTWD